MPTLKILGLDKELRDLEEAQRDHDSMVTYIRDKYMLNFRIGNGHSRIGPSKPDYFHVYKNDVLIVDAISAGKSKITIKVCPECKDHKREYNGQYHDCKNEIVDVVEYLDPETKKTRWIMKTLYQCGCFGPDHGKYR